MIVFVLRIIDLSENVRELMLRIKIDNGFVEGLLIDIFPVEVLVIRWSRGVNSVYRVVYGFKRTQHMIE